jgi:hypothetical protein
MPEVSEVAETGPSQAISSPPPSAYPVRQEGHARGKKLSLKRRITRQEDAFCEAVLRGWPYYRCYLVATGSNCKKSGAETGAWRMMQRPVVQAELTRRRQAMDEINAMTRIEKRVIISQIARDPGTPALARIGAVQVDNRMTGHDAPINVNVSGRVIFSVDPIAQNRAAVSPDSPAIDV